jgi:hypothetical protein
MIDKNVAAAIFCMKARAGWRETKVLNVRKIGSWDDLSEEELMALAGPDADDELPTQH